jgi:hypothetical protein
MYDTDKMGYFDQKQPTHSVGPTSILTPYREEFRIYVFIELGGQSCLSALHTLHSVVLDSNLVNMGIHRHDLFL